MLSARKFADLAVNVSHDRCILWPFATSGRGRYGKLTVNKKSVYAHRYACEQAWGAAPTPQHEAAHSCGVSLCISGRHLRWATKVVNAADKERHGTVCRGEKNGACKINAETVVAICNDPRTNVAVAKELGLSDRHVSAIRLKKKWAHVS